MFRPHASVLRRAVLVLLLLFVPGLCKGVKPSLCKSLPDAPARYAHDGDGRSVIPAVPDDYGAAVREAGDLYTRLVSLLRTVDAPQRYDAVRDSIRILWRRIATLESRYSELDPTVLSGRFFDDEAFQELSREFDGELERIRDGLPKVAALLDALIEEEVGATMGRDGMKGFEEMMKLYEGIVLALEAIKTPQDAARSHDTLRALAVQFKELEKKHSDLRSEFQLMAETSVRARALAQRLDAVFEGVLSDPDMERVFDALEPLASESNSSHIAPTPEEAQALEEYRVALEKVVEVLRRIKTLEDLKTFAEDVRALRELDRRFNERLPGERGELLVESDHRLELLLMQMGAEQMRIAENPELQARLSELLEGE